MKKDLMADLNGFVSVFRKASAGKKICLACVAPFALFFVLVIHLASFLLGVKTIQL